MGISQGASLRIVTEKSKLAMPEALIGLFPDVGGGYFLARCPGRVGEWLGLAGESLAASEAIAFGWADAYLPAAEQAGLWEALATQSFADSAAVQAFAASRTQPQGPEAVRDTSAIDRVFALPTVQAIIDTLEADTSSASSAWAQHTAAALRKRSPLLLHVILEQIRRARSMTMAEDLRMERDLVRHCFFPQHMGRKAVSSEIIEGIRALVVDKDNNPQWDPPRVEDVTPEMIEAFFESPWPASVHPLASLK